MRVVATVDWNGRIEVPRAGREALGLAPGALVTFAIEHGRVVVTPFDAGDETFHEVFDRALAEPAPPRHGGWGDPSD